MQVTSADTIASVPPAGAPSPLSGPYVGPDMGQLASYLGISLALILLVAGGGLLVHRMVRGGWRVRAAQRSLRVVDLLPLAGKNQLAVVQVYDRTLVLGIGEGGVRLVTEWEVDGPLPTGPAPRESTPVAAEAAPTRSTRAQALLAMLGAKAAAAQPQPAPAKPNFEADLEAVLERVLPRAVPLPPTELPAAPARRPARPAAEGKPRPAGTKAVARSTRPVASPRAADESSGEPRREAAVPRTVRGPTIDEMLRSEGVLG